MVEPTPLVRPPLTHRGCPYEVVDSAAQQADQKATTDVVDVDVWIEEAARPVHGGGSNWRRKKWSVGWNPSFNGLYRVGPILRWWDPIGIFGGTGGAQSAYLGFYTTTVYCEPGLILNIYIYIQTYDESILSIC
jgi:hypothetical protein